MCPPVITVLLPDENLKRAFSEKKGERRVVTSAEWSKVLLEKFETPVAISYRSRMKSSVRCVVGERNATSATVP